MVHEKQTRRLTWTGRKERAEFGSAKLPTEQSVDADQTDSFENASGTKKTGINRKCQSERYF